jgi:hypothetical protein
MVQRFLPAVIVTLILLVLGSCTSPPARPSADAFTAKEADLPLPDAGKPEAASEQRCMANSLTVEAARRENERLLEPAFLTLKRHAAFSAMIDSVVVDAKARAFKLAEKNAVKIVEGRVNTQVMSMIKNVLKERLAAYASCAAVASKDAAWCTAAGEAWDDVGPACARNFGIYVLIAQKVIAGKKTCGEALSKVKALEGEETRAFCEALSQQKPELCPWESLSIGNVLCQSAAARGTTSICSKGKFDVPERDEACCEQFGWRFANVAGSGAEAYVIPEAGAISGDAEGCARALRWGMLEDLGPSFDLDVPQPKGSDPAGKFGHYLCPHTIYWSSLEPP